MSNQTDDQLAPEVCPIAAQRAQAWRDLEAAIEQLHNLAQNFLWSKESSKEATGAYSDALFCLAYLKETENVA